MAVQYLTRVVVAFVQLVLAVTVCGLYGTDLNAARKTGEHADSRWVFAVVVGGLSGIVSLLYMIPGIISKGFLFACDWLLWLMWIILFGIFAKLFIHENCEDNGACNRLKHAVWIDLVNMLFWFATAIWATFNFMRHLRDNALKKHREQLDSVLARNSHGV